MSNSSAFLDAAKKRLLARKDELLGLLLTEGVQPKDKQVQDKGDEALSASMDKLQNSLEQNEIDEVNLINDALERIEEGIYGVCIDCDEAIAPRRLEYSPYAARCIPCQEELERSSGL